MSIGFIYNLQGNTPLHLAAWQGERPSCERLLESTAKLDTVNHQVGVEYF